MSRLGVVVVVVLWIGLTLLLGELPWSRRVPLRDRLAPYAPAATGTPGRRRLLSAGSFRDVIGPLVTAGSGRVLRLFGADDTVAATLVRLHAGIDQATFRLRQATQAGLALAAATAFSLVIGPPPLIGVLLVVGSPLLAFLVVEHRLQRADARRRARLLDELPVVLEQLGILLTAGHSSGSALNRLAGRGGGVVAEDLRRVNNRVRQGLGEDEALREWATVADCTEVERLVGVLALERHGTDLGRLIGEEARRLRGDAHRRQLETIERRAQLVWIPVTIATLVPGVLFMAVPFVDAMRTFAAL